MRDLKHLEPFKKVQRNRPRKEERPPLTSCIPKPRFTRKGWKILIFVGAVLLVTQLPSLLARLPLFTLERIELRGLKRLSQEEVVAMVGVTAGENLFSRDLNQISDELARNPWIARAEVRRYLPHTLSVTIHERQAVALVNAGDLYYLDRQGELFKLVEQGESTDLPVVTGLSSEELAADPEGCRTTLLAAMALMDRLAQGGGVQLADLSEIHWEQDQGFTLVTARQGITVHLGSEDLEGKLARLASIFRELNGVTAIDCDFSDKIIVSKG